MNHNGGIMDCAEQDTNRLDEPVACEFYVTLEPLGISMKAEKCSRWVLGFPMSCQG